MSRDSVRLWMGRDHDVRKARRFLQLETIVEKRGVSIAGKQIDGQGRDRASVSGLSGLDGAVGAPGLSRDVHE